MILNEIGIVWLFVDGRKITAVVRIFRKELWPLSEGK